MYPPPWEILPPCYSTLAGPTDEERLKIEQFLAVRKNFWLDIRSCRRRPQKDWRQLSVARLFVNEDEFDSLIVKATIARIQFTLWQAGLWPGEAFQLIDANRNGSLNPRYG